MSLRRKTPGDSLYLLLDTLCNAFGGIILLAVLVVLLTSKVKTQSATSSDSRDMLQRRLALAQTNLQQSLQLAASLQTKTNDDRWKAQVALISERKELQDALQQARDAMAQDSQALDAANAADPADRLKFLDAELARAQARELEASNRLTAETENINRLKQRQADLARQVAARMKDLQRPLRLPKEHETGKEVVYIILRFGRFYPCRNADLSRNETDISWYPFFGTETAQPIQGKGMDPVQNAAALNDYFKTLSGNSIYVVFCVFEDSFPAFMRAKELAIGNGIPYGWEPFLLLDGPVSFGSAGYTPKAQ
jgi:hypothetical protein